MDLTSSPAEPLARIKATAPDPVAPAEKSRLLKNQWEIRVKMVLPGRPNRKLHFPITFNQQLPAD